MNADNQNRIAICRVYTPPAVKEGTWILVDRLWPRGIKKDALAFDLWLKEITPSTALRQWFHEDIDRHWHEFIERYIAELSHKGDLIERILDMAEQAPVTLFYASKDPRHNHALILNAVLCSWPSLPDKALLLRRFDVQ
ncbi:DUF488 domain-containing protein [Legionella sp. CNM-4043-24]|uniref:DUF488 domain-containing protein n=1 Tax=Legionella sp. CNM-4043-24 TaxID=3421646 RepID=UPI00403AD817